MNEFIKRGQQNQSSAEKGNDHKTNVLLNSVMVEEIDENQYDLGSSIYKRYSLPVTKVCKPLENLPLVSNAQDENEEKKGTNESSKPPLLLENPSSPIDKSLKPPVVTSHNQPSQENHPPLIKQPTWVETNEAQPKALTDLKRKAVFSAFLIIPATLIGGAIGGVVGFFVGGPVGAAIGACVGAVAGAAIPGAVAACYQRQLNSASIARPEDVGREWSQNVPVRNLRVHSPLANQGGFQNPQTVQQETQLPKRNIVQHTLSVT